MRLAILLAPLLITPALAQTPQAALHHALARTAARAIILDATSGATTATFGNTSEPFTPGSTLKPFVLLAALNQNYIQPKSSLPCRGTLTVGPHNLACTHPHTLHQFTARDALAYSCNAYFAAIAQRMTPDALTAALTTFGLQPSTQTPQRILLALGLEGIAVSPRNLADAYRRLALSPASPATDLVRSALLDSVHFGMANNAATVGITLAGKTGTATEPHQPWTHGWFAGIIYDDASHPKQIIVILLPHGSGADAALLAHRYLQAVQSK